MMRIYLHSVTTYNPVLQDSSSNPMLFRCFFSEDTWDSSDHELFQIWVTWPNPLWKIHVCHTANQPRSKRCPWEVNLPKNQKMVDPKMQMLGDSEDFDLASEKLGALPTKVLERGALLKRWVSVDVFDASGTRCVKILLEVLLFVDILVAGKWHDCKYSSWQDQQMFP